jgi:PII-like signaling protein
METTGPGELARVYVGESDHWHVKALYTAIVERARAEGLAGATVTRGVAGFGASSRIHTASILLLSEDLPIRIESVDSEERIARFLPLLAETVTESLITVQDCEVVKHSHEGA